MNIILNISLVAIFSTLVFWAHTNGEGVYDDGSTDEYLCGKGCSGLIIRGSDLIEKVEQGYLERTVTTDEGREMLSNLVWKAQNYSLADAYAQNIIISATYEDTLIRYGSENVTIEQRTNSAKFSIYHAYKIKLINDKEYEYLIKSGVVQVDISDENIKVYANASRITDKFEQLIEKKQLKL